jgi:hypothetical protein
LRRVKRLDNGGTPPAGRTRGLDSQRPTRRFPLRSRRQPCGSTAAGPYRTGRQNLGAAGGGGRQKAGAARRAPFCTGPFPLSLLPSAPVVQPLRSTLLHRPAESRRRRRGGRQKAGPLGALPSAPAHFHFRSYHQPCASTIAERSSAPAGSIKSWRRSGQRAAGSKTAAAPRAGPWRSALDGRLRLARIRTSCAPGPTGAVRRDLRVRRRTNACASGRHARAKSATCSIS